MVEKDPPPAWGADDLTSFFDDNRQNQWATFFHKRQAVNKLIALDAQFAEVSKDWLNPHSEIAASLLVRCHSAFRVSTGLALAGQAAEAFPLCRAMLEYAAYAVHIDRHSDLPDIWLNRHEDEESAQAQRNAFSHRRVLVSVTAANQHAAERFEELYQRTIDLGGHPNERAVTSNITMVEEPGKRTMLNVLQHDDSAQLDQVITTVAQCGLASLEMLQVVFSARFELLGISAEMLKLRRGL